MIMLIIIYVQMIVFDYKVKNKFINWLLCTIENLFLAHEGGKGLTILNNMWNYSHFILNTCPYIYI